MNINPFGPYYAGAFRTAITSCFINGKITEQQIDHLTMSSSEKEELKNQWEKWLDATTHGIKDELRAEGELI